VDGTCTVPEPCADDDVTVDSLTAARAALDAGAPAVDLSPGGCIRYVRTVDGDQLTSDTLTFAGQTEAEYVYTADGATGREDADLDGFFESDTVLTLGTSPEVMLELRELDPGSGEVVTREQRMGTGDTVHVLVEQYGVIVDQFDTPAEQAVGTAAAGTAVDCDVDHFFRYLQQMMRCMERTSKCLKQHGRKDVARGILRMGMKVAIKCGDLGGDAYAHANAREAAAGRKPEVTIDPAKADGTTADFLASTMCHELMHFGKLGLHDPALSDNPRRGEMDPVYACEELCGFSGLGDGPTKCHCATCLGPKTTVCDPRCAPYRDCDPQMGAICPCSANHVWYPTYTICKSECPSGISCFGYSDCLRLDRSCN
jgi:hypothetical protein